VNNAKETQSDFLTWSPYTASADFRNYVYNSIVLAWETKRVSINSASYSKSILQRECNLHVLNLRKLSDVQLHDQGKWKPEEFIIFYNEGRGYECLFKRLRDTFAHGHYGQSKRGWITIRHRYKNPREKVENTRVFGNLKVTTLKKLVAFLDTSYGGVNNFV
jgi:hypothetical protein